MKEGERFTSQHVKDIMANFQLPFGNYAEVANPQLEWRTDTLQDIDGNSAVLYRGINPQDTEAMILVAAGKDSIAITEQKEGSRPVAALYTPTGQNELGNVAYRLPVYEIRELVVLDEPLQPNYHQSTPELVDGCAFQTGDDLGRRIIPLGDVPSDIPEEIVYTAPLSIKDQGDFVRLRVRNSDRNPNSSYDFPKYLTS